MSRKGTAARRRRQDMHRGMLVQGFVQGKQGASTVVETTSPEIACSRIEIMTNDHWPGMPQVRLDGTMRGARQSYGGHSESVSIMQVDGLESAILEAGLGLAKMQMRADGLENASLGAGLRRLPRPHVGGSAAHGRERNQRPSGNSHGQEPAAHGRKMSL